MIYSVGMVIECKKIVNTQELEMTNPTFDIQVGDRYKVTDKDEWPDDNHCHWYELQSEKDSELFLNAWNDDGHMIIDERFRVVGGE